MCGRCRQVFNAFESLKRVEDDYVVPSADEPVQPAGAPMQTMSDEVMTVDDAEDASFRNEHPAESVVRNSRTDDRELEPDESNEIDSVQDEPSAVGSPSAGFIGFKDLSSGAYLPLQLPTELPNDDRDRPTSGSPGVAQIAWLNATQQADNTTAAADNLSVPRSLLEPEPRFADIRMNSDNFVGINTNAVDDARAEEGELAQANDALNIDPPWLRSKGAKAVKPARTKLWLLGCAVMLLALALQLSYIFRAAIIEAIPQTRPHFVNVCDAFGCAITWGRDSNMIKIVESDLIEPPDKPGRILVTATLANRAVTKQDLPSLELRLTDAANQVLISRVLQPSDYLGRAVQRDDGIAPGAELLINLNIESSNKTVASGYGLRAFYPQ